METPVVEEKDVHELRAMLAASSDRVVALLNENRRLRQETFEMAAKIADDKATDWNSWVYAPEWSCAAKTIAASIRAWSTARGNAGAL